MVGWGWDINGQSTVPAGLSQVTAIVAGAHHSLALKEDGTVVAWGYNVLGQSTVPAGVSKVTAIAAGAHHSLALKEDGTVVAWGVERPWAVDGSRGAVKGDGDGRRLFFIR